jgi:hypothetical protein
VYGCVKDLLVLFTSSTAVPTKDEYPFVLTGGPYGGGGDTQDQVYDVTLRPDRSESPTENRINTLVACLESLRADDYRLKTITPTELDKTKIAITVDPLSGTVKKIVYKYVGLYFQINFRDFGKDIVVSAPVSD